MNIAELKLNFFRQIDRLDKVKLEEAYGVLLNYLNSKDDLDEWNNLTAEQRPLPHESPRVAFAIAKTLPSQI